MSEVENGLACKNRCEKAVLLANEMVQRNMKAYEKTATVYSGLGWAMVLFGAVPLLIGFSSLTDNHITSAIISLLFAIFFLFGAFVCFRGAKQIKSRE